MYYPISPQHTEASPVNRTETFYYTIKNDGEHRLCAGATNTLTLREVARKQFVERELTRMTKIGKQQLHFTQTHVHAHVYT